jgi:hypothetical protein
VPTLPENPDLPQLRRQAKELLRSARAGHPAALARLAAVDAPPGLTGAQLALAREHGAASWPALVRAVEAARLAPRRGEVERFLGEAIGGRPERALALLAERCGLEAAAGLAGALVLGDDAEVRAALEDDPALVNRPHPATGWLPLHAVCASRLHVEPARAAGLLRSATLLLDAGADPAAALPGPAGGRTPVRCAVGAAMAGPGGEPILALLLARGAPVGDHDLYLAGFAREAARCVALLLGAVPGVAALAAQALAAPVSTGDVEVARRLLEAGADPARYRDDDGRPGGAVAAAVRAGAPAALVALLLDHGADPDAPGPDGRAPLQAALARGEQDLAALLRTRGAVDAPTPTGRFVALARRGERAAAERALAADPGLPGRLDPAEAAALPHAAAAGDTAAVALMLDLGFPVDAASAEDDGATALHLAAYTGRPALAALLLARGADLDARDATWGSPALAWAAVGSGERPDPDGDWAGVVRVLLDAGADPAAIDLDPAGPKPPSREVAALLRARAG